MAKNIHLTEDEQLAKIKRWWKNNGTSIVTGVILGLCLIFGYNWWQKHQQNRALEASDLFAGLIQASETDDLEKLDELAIQLKNDYGKHDYAAKGLILAAASQIKSGNPDQAKENLLWVLDHSDQIDNQLLAGYRLARQYYREGAYDDALALLDIEQRAGFESQYSELIGDIYRSQGDLEKSREAYLQALDTLPPATAGSGYSEILQLKLDNTAQ